MKINSIWCCLGQRALWWLWVYSVDSTGDELRLGRILFQRLASFRFGTTTYVQTTVYQWNGFGSAADEMGCPLPTVQPVSTVQPDVKIFPALVFPSVQQRLCRRLQRKKNWRAAAPATTSIQPRYLIETEYHLLQRFLIETETIRSIH